MEFQYPYPEKEHYVLPRNLVEQTHDELRMYPAPADLRLCIEGLRKMYAKTPYMQSMKQYAALAGVLKSEQGPLDGEGKFNFDFYRGALLGLHMNLAPEPVHAKRRVLYSKEILAEGIDESPVRDEIYAGLRESLEEWVSNKKDSWYSFLADQGDDYIEAAIGLAAALYDDREDSEEAQLDCVAGFAFATKMVQEAI